MAGANCRGLEKARRVQEAIDTTEFEVWAYGDTSGDQALLALADHPVWIGNRARRVLRGANRPA
jgi:phosphatidylglycerophosphatase C